MTSLYDDFEPNKLIYNTNNTFPFLFKNKIVKRSPWSFLQTPLKLLRGPVTTFFFFLLGLFPLLNQKFVATPKIYKKLCCSFEIVVFMTFFRKNSLTS